MKCRVCLQQIDDYEIIKNVNMDVTGLYTSFEKSNKVDVKFFHCKNCGHNMIENMIKENHYTKYNILKIGKKDIDSGGGNSLLLKKYYMHILMELSHKAIDNKKILDIGCGTGKVLEYAGNYFDECKGIDPSEPECRIARSKGCDVINDFFDDRFPEEGFSAFVSLQVLEHLDAPMVVIRNAYRILKPGGIGYIDVPNGQEIYRKSRYYDIYEEHVNYFSISSLSKLVTEVGFEIISLNEVLHGNHIGILLRKSNLHKKFEDARNNDISKFTYYTHKYKKISVWGAGIKGRCFLQTLPLNDQKKIRHLFDSNKVISDCYIPNCIIPIELPNDKTVQDNDLIIITAIEYKEQIILDLKSKYKYKGKIVCIDEEESL